MNEELLQQVDESLGEEAANLGRDLQMVNEIIHGNFSKLLAHEGQVVQSY